MTSLLGVSGESGGFQKQEWVTASEGQSDFLRTSHPNSAAGSVLRSPELKSRSMSYQLGYLAACMV